MTGKPRDPVTDPKAGDVWMNGKGRRYEMTGIEARQKTMVSNALYTGYTPAIVIPLELAQRMMQLGDAVKGGAGYIADALAQYLPQTGTQAEAETADNPETVGESADKNGDRK